MSTLLNTSPTNSPRTPSSSPTANSMTATASPTIRATVSLATSYELHDDEKTDVASDVKRRAQGFLDTVKQRTTMFRQNLTTQAWLFIVNVVVSVVTLAGVSAALLYEALSHQHRDSTVGEDYGLNMCSFQIFQVYLTTSALYSISDLLIGCVFALWYAFRAVRHEKEALLVVFALVVLGVVGRAVYFSFVTAYYWVTGLSLATIQVFLCLGSLGLLIAVAQTWRVGRSFGWRMYTKGVASVADVARMGKLKTLDAASKLDLFLTINAFNTFFFFAPDTTIRYLGFAFTAVTAMFLLAIPVMVKKQMFFVSYVFAVFGLVLPAFYLYLLVIIFEKDPNRCFEPGLATCAAAQNISRVARTLDFTDFPAIFNVTGCIDCRNETAFSPNRLCWVNMMSNGIFATTNRTNANWTTTTTITTSITTTTSTMQPQGVTSSSFSFLTACVQQVDAKVHQCCAEFGRCELKIKLVDSNAPMAVFVVICAILTRLATMIFGVQQARIMDVPSVTEMIERGQRTVSNALSFQFLGSQSPPTTARIRNNGEHEQDDLSGGAAAADRSVVASFGSNNKKNSGGGGGRNNDGAFTTCDANKEKEEVYSSMPTPRYEVAFAEGK